MRKNFLPLPQKLDYSAGSGTGTDTTAIRPATNPRNYDPTSDMPYYEYICTWLDDFMTVLHDATAIMR